MRLQNAYPRTAQRHSFYCPVSGEFTWIKRSKYTRKSLSDIAGHTHQKTGYVSITIDRKFNAAHRLAWLYMTGSYPENCIDHINGVKHDNSFANLRDVEHATNCKNRKRYKTNTSGVSGVYMDKATGLWEVRFKHNNKKHYFGRYKTVDEAIKVREQEIKNFDFYRLHGKK